MKSFVKFLAIPAVLLSAAVTVRAQQSEEKPEQLSSTEIAKRVALLDQQVTDDARQIVHLQAVARKAKDVVKLSCFNDVFVQLKALQNLFDSAHTQFEDTGAATAYGPISEAGAAIKKLRGDAEACVGVPDLYKQESDVLVTHPDFPDDPTTADPFAPEVEPVIYASPYG
jgi:hypothetical protein